MTDAAHGTVTLNGDGTFTYRPTANYFGTDSFSYRVNDGALDSTTATVALTITPVNDAPVAADASVSLSEDGTLAIDPRNFGTDIDSATLTPTIAEGPVHGTLTANPDGTYSYAPAADFNGTDGLRFKLSDGELNSNEATLSLTITPVNDAPTLSARTVDLAEDGTLVIDPLTGAADADGDALVARVVTDPAHGTLTVEPDGRWTYRSAPNYSGADSLSYVVSDGTVDSAPALITLTINPANDPPTLADQTASLAEDGTLVIDPRSFGADVDRGTLTALIVESPAHGTLTTNPDGTYTYAPAADFNGTDTLRFKLSDGELESNEATLTLRVASVNDAPMLAGRTISLAEGSGLTFNPLSTAADVDSNILTAALVDAPTHGTLTVNPDGSFTYRPTAGYIGPDRFTYRVSDGLAESNVAEVALTVTPVNTRPTAADSLVTGTEDTALVLRWSDFAVADPDGDPLTLTLTALPVEGGLQRRTAQGDWTATHLGDTFTRADLDAGNLRLVPAANASGGPGYAHAGDGNRHEHYARIGYTVSDGRLASAPAAMVIDIAAVADAPALSVGGNVESTRELFHTTWESVVNRSNTPTLVQQNTLEGWTRIAASDHDDDGHDDWDDDHHWDDDHDHDDDSNHGFEIWSTGDRMFNAQNQRKTVAAAANGGLNWLALNDAEGEGHETFGIQRSFDTVAGAVYTLDFDMAGQLGYGANYTRFAIYVDSVKLGEDAPTSPATGLNWQHRSYSFTGTGGAQTLRIVSEAIDTEDNGRGVMLDNLVLTETRLFNSGAEDTAIKLPALQASLADTDGSESLTVTLTGLPIGGSLSDGVHSFTVSADQRIADLSAWNPASLRVTPPAHYSGPLALLVQASAIETATGSRSTVETTLNITVEPVVDAPGLVLIGRDTAPSRELIATSWETANNANTSAKIVKEDRFEGWDVLSAASNKEKAFEIWSAGDKMRNPSGQLVTVQPAAGDGNDWLGLTNGVAGGVTASYQNLGIERTIATVNQAVYTLSFDYAGALGLPASDTQIGVYVDGVRLGTYANTSGTGALAWQTANFQFIGTGAARTVRIQLEGGSGTASARGASLDDLHLVETLPAYQVINGAGTVYGLANGSVALPQIQATLTDTDGSEGLKVELLGLPAKATVSDGVRTATLAASGALDLTGWNLAALNLRPKTGHTGTLTLQVRATATEANHSGRATATAALNAIVLDGASAATPAGAIPYVSLAQATVLQASMSGAEPLRVQPTILGPHLVEPTGTIHIGLPEHRSDTRGWEGEEAEDEARRERMGDEWLRELEASAREHWEQWMGR